MCMHEHVAVTCCIMTNRKKLPVPYNTEVNKLLTIATLPIGIGYMLLEPDFISTTPKRPYASVGRPL
jgi:hypothetical protein